LVGGECGVEGNGFAVWIGDRDLLRAGVEAGSNDEESVGVLECDDGGFSVGADGGAALESAAADGESGAAHGGNRCGRNRADSQGDGGELDDGQGGVCGVPFEEVMAKRRCPFSSVVRKLP
jgi:hypothetical protein